MTRPRGFIRRHRRVIVTIVAVLALAVAGVFVTAEWISRQQMEESLARQAAEIAAHRQAQRAETRDTPAVTPSVPSSVTRNAAPSAASAPASPAVRAIAWTTQWTDFRGARRDGHFTAGPLRTDWTTLRPLWRQPVGGGHASFVVADGRAFTVEQRGHDEVAAAYDVLTGRELWTNAWNATFNEYNAGVGPRATPTFHDETLFVLGATGELRALDASSGKLRWRANILEDADADNLYWGMAASPLVVGNTVVTVPGGDNGRAIVAYDRATGRVAWSALDDGAAYSSPMPVTLAGVDQIVVFLAARVVGVSPDRGALLWEFPWETQDGINVAQPVVIGDNRVFVSSGCGVGGAVFEITRDGDRLTARGVWRTHRMKNTFTTSVHHDVSRNSRESPRSKAGRGTIRRSPSAFSSCATGADGGVRPAPALEQGVLSPWRGLAGRLSTRSCRLGLARSPTKPTVGPRGARLRRAPAGPHQRGDANDIDLALPLVGEACDPNASIWLTIGVCVQIGGQHSAKSALRLLMGVGRRIDG